jgi:hypothetical protein
MAEDRPLPFGCAGCRNRWKGVNTCHCGSCHRTFPYLGSFDRHECVVAARKRRSKRPFAGVIEVA